MLGNAPYQMCKEHCPIYWVIKPAIDKNLQIFRLFFLRVFSSWFYKMENWSRLCTANVVSSMHFCCISKSASTITPLLAVAKSPSIGWNEPYSHLFFPFSSLSSILALDSNVLIYIAVGRYNLYVSNKNNWLQSVRVSFRKSQATAIIFRCFGN